MTDSSLQALRQLLVLGYDQLKARLTQKLGSSELAGEAVQDTWLRLHHASSVGPVRNPANYLFRIALNVARDRLATDRRYLTFERIDTVDLADDAAGPADVFEARSELARVERLIAELPPRQRQILVAARLDGLPRGEIARRFGVSLSTVEKELKSAHEYCLSRINSGAGR